MVNSHCISKQGFYNWLVFALDFPKSSELYELAKEFTEKKGFMFSLNYSEGDLMIAFSKFLVSKGKG